MKPNNSTQHKLSLAGLLITLGIVYGDLGTSPLYVMKAILTSAGHINEAFILGAISCIFWTLTLQTTVKYVLLTLRADNKGEGGIFSLYALVRRKAKWAFIFAIIGGSTLLADGIITPAITVTSAVEGLRFVNHNLPVLPIILVIITALFTIQQFGTRFLGKVFGPTMVIWFSMLAIIGIWQITSYPAVLKAFNPIYAYKLLVEYPGGFFILGAVFLATTGAEALYSDLGHCGLRNIQISWIFVKSSLILNYLGQGAWILTHPELINGTVNPFYAAMPSWFLITGILIATAASVIASQALISGSYTIVSEAILLNFWPKLKISYPAAFKGQMYISSINWMLFICCVFVILYFRESSNMEAAYGLSITITMLMTTVLLAKYLQLKHVSPVFLFLLLAVYFSIEGSFLFSNLQKFTHGGWVTIMIAGFLIIVMFVWYKGREIKKGFTAFVKIKDYEKVLTDLRNDTTLPLYANNLVYLTRADYSTDIESKIIYSLINKSPKRANKYWFIHVHVLDEPWTLEYSVESLVPDVINRVEFRIGFKIQPRVNLYFKQVIEEMKLNHECELESSYPSLKKHGIPGDFKYVIIDRIQNYDFNFAPFDQLIMDIYAILKKVGISDVRAYGLDTSSVLVEHVPLQMETQKPNLIRVKPNTSL
jgi:KUP system potassium uptake protein